MLATQSLLRNSKPPASTWASGGDTKAIEPYAGYIVHTYLTTSTFIVNTTLVADILVVGGGGAGGSSGAEMQEEAVAVEEEPYRH